MILLFVLHGAEHLAGTNKDVSYSSSDGILYKYMVLLCMKGSYSQKASLVSDLWKTRGPLKDPGELEDPFEDPDPQSPVWAKLVEL
jgi:hypothetical protein